MDQQRIDEIRARCEAATPGVWGERWLPIPGYEGYEVSDFGNVRSYFLKGNHKKKRAEFPRTLALRGSNYPSVSLPKPKSGGYHTRRVHRLVMLAFVGECPDGYEVAHLNGNNSDNRLSNLAYVTHIENESHKVAHGTSSFGDGNSGAVLQGWQVAEIKYLASKSVPQGKIAALFEISHKQVHSILSGRTWLKEPPRADIPDLLAEVERLRAELEAAKRDIEIALGTQRVCFACKNVIPCSNSITGEYGCDPKWRGLCAENGGAK